MEVLREIVKKINHVFLKHRFLFLQERRPVKHLPCTNKHRCLRKAWFISLSTSPKHLALYKALATQVSYGGLCYVCCVILSFYYRTVMHARNSTTMTMVVIAWHDYVQCITQDVPAISMTSYN
jgi:hypothetical protein